MTFITGRISANESSNNNETFVGGLIVSSRADIKIRMDSCSLSDASKRVAGVFEILLLNTDDE